MTTELDQPQERRLSLRDHLESEKFKGQIARVLPKHCKPERMIRVAITAMMRTPDLARCTQESFFLAMLNLSQLGIEPDGRRAHLIPYRNNKAGTYECQLIVDYKGLVELAMRSGAIRKIHADVVCENDVFRFDLGEVRTHQIGWKQPRGDVYAAYALAETKDGAVMCEVLSKDEIEAIRARSRAKNAGPWVTDWNEMAKKTAFRRLSKWLPLSPEYRDALDMDADVIEVTAEPARHAGADFDLIGGSDDLAQAIGAAPAKTKVEAEPEMPLGDPKLPAKQVMREKMSKEGVGEKAVLDFLESEGPSYDDLAAVSEEHAQYVLDNWNNLTA